MSVRDYKPGEIIHGDLDDPEPFCKTVSIVTQKGKICDACFKKPELGLGCSLKRCTGCLHMYYCSQDCQKKDWKNGHKIECGSETFRTSFLNIEAVEIRCQLLRCYALLKMKPEMAEKPYGQYDGTTRCFNDLFSLEESFENRQIHHVCAELALKLLIEGLEDENLIDLTKYLMKMAGVFENHGFTIYDLGEMTQLGSGIYFGPSNLKHSCRPNAMYCTKGTRMEIRALAPIKKGEKAKVTYIGGQHLGKEDRKSLLLSRYDFNCTCEICESAVDDNGVDFHRLDNLLTFFQRCEQEESFARSNSEARILSKHHEILGMMRKIYNEYDDRVSTQFRKTVFALINGFKYLGVPDIKKLVEEARAHLKISYGEDHTEYIEFERALIFNQYELKSM